ARRQLSTALEATTDVVGITDVRGRIIYLNSAARELFGIGPTEDVTRLDVTRYQPEATRRKLQEVALKCAVRDGVWSGETEMRAHDGREVPVSQVIVAPKTAGGKVDFFATIARDISERKHAEA